MVNMERKMGEIGVILNDLGFEKGVSRTWLYPWVYSKSIKMGIVTAKYTIEFENFDSVIHLNIFGMDYKMNFNTEDLIKENAIIDAMLKILIKAERARTRIYNNFIDELNDLK